MALISTRTRGRLRDRLQQKFEREARKLAERLLQPQARTRDWHRGMKRLLTDYLIQQSAVGKGSPLNAADIARLNDVILEQQAFLSRFADEVGLRRMRHQSLTVDYLAARSNLYAGAGIDEWYRQFEGDAQDGEIVYYIAVDDGGTCSPCLAAEEGSPYPPQSGPFPGSVCLGRGRCRCRRETRFDPTAARRSRAA
jgi:hypothetical protein